MTSHFLPVWSGWTVTG